MAKNKISHFKFYVISRSFLFVWLLTGFLIAKRFDLFGYGSDSYISLILQSVFTILLYLAWDLISRRKRTKKQMNITDI